MRNVFDKNNRIKLEFRKGSGDNPKVNAILVVRGGKENTHYNNWVAYLKTVYDIQKEKEEKRAKEEALFQENTYDFDEDVDGQGPMNKLLAQPYFTLECTVFFFLFVFFKVLPGGKRSE